jgi:hypothetical protein
LAFSGFSASAKEIAGVAVPETVQTDDGTTLQLNGAGIRSKFFLDIYVAGLYVEQPSKSAEQVIAAQGRKRVVMHILFKNVDRSKLVSAWNDGFENNTAADEVVKLRKRIDRFNSFFPDVKRGDVLLFDFIPGKGTVVSISGEEKGVIEGKDFNDGLLRNWLGKKPVTKDLKQDFLGL